MNIVEALEDPKLFGALPAFKDLTTWRAWLAFLRAFYGLAMDAEDLALFRKHTGRTTPREGGYPEAVCITGRQSGKTQVAGIVGAFEAMQAALRGVRGQFVPLVAQDMRGAQRALLGYVSEVFEAPLLVREVARSTSSEIELVGGVTVGVYPCRPAALRGIRAPLAVVDELAFFVTSDGRPTDREMLRAIRPTLATTRGRLLVLSSPYAQAGALWEMRRTHHGREDSPVLLWQASAPEMNPTLPQDYLDRMREEDPEGYRSEVLGEFRAGLSSLFDPEALDDVVVAGRRELAPVPGLTYAAFADPSGGRADAFTLAIGHANGRGAVVVDLLRAWSPERGQPLNPSIVVAEIRDTLRTYGLARVTGDRFGAEWVAEAFRLVGVSYEVAAMDRSALYLELLPAVNAGAVELLDIPELLRELRGLERRRGSSGRDRVDHRPGYHDDRANAVAGVVSLLRACVQAFSVSSSPGPGVLAATYDKPLAQYGEKRRGLLH